MILLFKCLEFNSKWEHGNLDPLFVNVQKSSDVLLLSLPLLFFQKLKKLICAVLVF